MSVLVCLERLQEDVISELVAGNQFARNKGSATSSIAVPEPQEAASFWWSRSARAVARCGSGSHGSGSKSDDQCG
jgi:hypothetical protein